MSDRKADHRRMIYKLANEYGGAVELRKAGHYCLTIDGRKFFTGSSPSCPRASINFEKMVRNVMRGDSQNVRHGDENRP